MSGNFRAAAICLVVAGLGAVAAVVCVLIQPSIPLPRWDLLICLTLAVAAIGGSIGFIRGSATTNLSNAGESKYWWPAQRNGWIGFVIWTWVVPVFFVAYAATSSSSQAWEIVDSGHSIEKVEVDKVLSSEFVQSKQSGHHSTKVQVSAPFNQGRRPVEDKFASDSPVEVGDQVWVLYAPSEPGLGALIDNDRGSLETQIGGPAETSLVLAAIGWTAFSWMLNLFGSVRPDPMNTIKRALKAGRVRVVPVTVGHVGVQVDERPSKSSKIKRPKPCVQLTTSDGRRLDLYLDEVVDPVPLSRFLTDAQSNLYWRPPAQELPYGKSVGYSVLVLNDRRCLQGWLESTNGGDLPEGSPVPASEELPEGRELRAIRPFPVRDRSLHSGGLWALLASLLALLIIPIGVGTFLTVFLATVAFLLPMVAKSVYKGRLTRYLQGLLPDTVRVVDS
ncbi:hypothetical protein [Streptomyces sp. Wb2n-11]|uniref:hypothetical protein n=1 Tax=Streptomyces sp. Wb2n-11 TaxID=1030533 RepID=UPI000AC18920|nr:hypothetical protein [Streptomyces sp. Wb2n-11]